MSHLFLIGLKTLSGVILGLTLSIVIQVLAGIGIFSMTFITITTTFAFLKLTWYLKYRGLITIDLFFISLFFLFKLYVHVSAG